MPNLLTIDEINKLYDPTDRIIKYLVKKNIDKFDEAICYLNTANAKRVVSFSEDFFEDLEDTAELAYLRLANDVLKEHGGGKVGRDWIKALLKETDPVTKYCFHNEVERKRGRFVETVIVSDNRPDDIHRALRDWSRMTNQYAVAVTDEALKHSYKKNDIEYVKWVAMHDRRCCGDCDSRDGEIYLIDKVPAKPHWGCRCRLVGYKK